ncbi:MAG: HAMP domain-containing protein [Gammaproteobacteria bacterium]|nr:hypothetical protein [Gammaproteobacteria bacterium]MDP6098325.1 HAMP domain-containing protein [Gammaproteobacteria bacterium]MDP7456284.1 HAMP domain-containing protein [Gammaproteobacteria bacterium]
MRTSNDGTWDAYLPPLDLAQMLGAATEPLLSTIHLEGHEFPARTIYGLLTDEGGNYIIQITESLEESEDVLEIFRLTSLVSLPFVILLSLMSGWLIARASLSGVHQVTSTAIDISNGALSERVPPADHGLEIDRLATTFNDMLDKIQLLIGGMREMNDNIAHDLKSPLARIRGIAETTLTGNQDDVQYQQLAASTIEECD